MTKTRAQKQRRRQRRQNLIQPVREIVVTAPRRTKKQKRKNKQNRLARMGRELGGLVGFPNVGALVGQGISKITGSGQYAISNLPKMNSLAGSTPPVFGTLGGVTRVKHREFITDIYGSTDFAIQRYNLNPGSTGLFPWLSQLAHNYEQYHIHGICLEFKSTSASALNSTNTALGVVALVTQYEANDPIFQTKQQVENYEGAQSANPSQCILHFVECALGENVLDRLYVRAPGANVDDPRFFDLGEFSIMTQGMQAVANIGELWVSYDVEFYKPKLNPAGINDPGADVYYKEVFPATATTIAPFGEYLNRIDPSMNILNTYLISYGTGNGAGLYLTPNTPAGYYQFLYMGYANDPTADMGGFNFDAYDGVEAVSYMAASGAFGPTEGEQFGFILATVKHNGLGGHIEFDPNWVVTTSLVSSYLLFAALPEKPLVPPTFAMKHQKRRLKDVEEDGTAGKEIELQSLE